MRPSYLFLSLFLSASAFAEAPAGRVIVIDPGHATLNYEGSIINPGKISRGGVKEAKVALAIALKLGEALKKEGMTVHYTRTNEDFWREAYNNVEDNKARAFYANRIGADAYLSIHCDWDPRPRVHGVTTYYAKDNSKKLGALIQKNMVQDLDARNRKLIKDSYTVLDVADMPAVIVETGFISNGSESKRLGDPKYQARVAGALAKSVKNYFEEAGAK